MGLDAVVYRNVENVRATGQAHAYGVNEDTGEVFFIGDENHSVPEDVAVAVAVTIGNVAMVSELRERIESLLPKNDSVILQRILYSGIHCGDVIRSEMFAHLKKEVQAIRDATNDILLVKFVGKLEKLMRAAEAEHNPIVFV